MNASHIAHDSINNSGVPGRGGKILTLNVPVELTQRYLYLHLESEDSVSINGEFWFDASVRLYNQDTLVSELPANAAHSNVPPGITIPGIRICMFASGVATANSMNIVLRSPFTNGVADVTLQPTIINASIDRIELHCNGVHGPNVTGWRAVLICVSN